MSAMTLQNTRRGCLAGLLAAALPLRAADAGYEWRRWPAKKPTPAAELDRLEGGRWRLPEARGQVVLLNFWATWCEPCRSEMPSLQRLAQRSADQGLHVVAVNYAESPAAVQRFLAAQGLQLPTVLLDRDGAAAKAWTPRIFPSTAVIDRRGRAAGVLVGAIDWDGEAAAALLAPFVATRP